jgi:hypothetical protein
VGGGIYSERSNPQFTNCKIGGNYADYGGGLSYNYLEDDEDSWLINCEIAKNSAYHGGALYCDNYSDPTLINCTIVGNTAESDSGGVFCDSSSPDLLNCLLWENSGNAIFLSGASLPSVDYSCIQGGFDGTGNVELDPMFVDVGSGDYRLQIGSPCIDSGDADNWSMIPPDTFFSGDLLGRFRVWDGDGDGNPIVDMGAYEFGSPPNSQDLDENGFLDPMDLFVFQKFWHSSSIPTKQTGSKGTSRFNANDLVNLLNVWVNQ